MAPRKALFQLHWIFGITVGIVLAIVGATGALLSFEQQIVASLAREDRQVEANGRAPLAPAELIARVAGDEPQKHITGLNIVREPAETVRVTFAPREHDPGFHELKVSVTTPNLQVRARRGYWLAGSLEVR